jgi:hypothetical protein
MPYQLTKQQRKIARIAINKGLMKEYEAGLRKIEAVLIKWINDELDNKQAYLEAYKKLTGHDRHIAKRYNDVKESDIKFVLAHLLAENLISMDDLEGLSQTYIAGVLFLAGKSGD